MYPISRYPRIFGWKHLHPGDSWTKQLSQKHYEVENTICKHLPPKLNQGLLRWRRNALFQEAGTMAAESLVLSAQVKVRVQEWHWQEYQLPGRPPAAGQKVLQQQTLLLLSARGDRQPSKPCAAPTSLYAQTKRGFVSLTWHSRLSPRRGGNPDQFWVLSTQALENPWNPIPKVLRHCGRGDPASLNQKCLLNTFSREFHNFSDYISKENIINNRNTQHSHTSLHNPAVFLQRCTNVTYSVTSGHTAKASASRWTAEDFYVVAACSKVCCVESRQRQISCTWDNPEPLINLGSLHDT